MKKYEEIEDITKTVKLLEESGLLINVISEAIKNKAKEQKGAFLPTLAASILRSVLIVKGVTRAVQGTIRAQWILL